MVVNFCKLFFQFPVGRIHRHLKNRTTSHGRVGATAAVYSAAEVSARLVTGETYALSFIRSRTECIACEYCIRGLCLHGRISREFPTEEA